MSTVIKSNSILYALWVWSTLTGNIICNGTARDTFEVFHLTVVQLHVDLISQSNFNVYYLTKFFYLI